MVGPFFLRGIAREDFVEAGWRWLSVLAENPVRTMQRVAGLWEEYAAILNGARLRSPATGDRRFQYEAWETSPFSVLLQAYLANCAFLYRMVDESESLSEAEQTRLNFFAVNVAAMLAPTNTLAGNPSALSRAIASHGRSLVNGAMNYATDLVSNKAMPAMVDLKRFEVGKNLAATPGGVVWRSAQAELVQYSPTTRKVRELPCLIVPPLFNKYYFVDMAPGHSLVEHLVGEGHQVFMMSWRNPKPEHAQWNADTYSAAVLDSMEVVRNISRAERINVVGVCGGTRVLAPVLGYLHATDNDWINSASLMIINLLSDKVPHWPVAHSRIDEKVKREGIMSGGDIAAGFTWSRPQDLVWSYWSNNYLHGKAPPAIDLLYWNRDSTNIPSALRDDLIDCHVNNSYLKEGGVTVKGVPVSIGDLNYAKYVVAGKADHINDWRNVFETGRLLGRTMDFVLSNHGHIQTIIDPPQSHSHAHSLVGKHHRSCYWCGPGLARTPEEWLETAQEEEGSWWPHWAAWLHARSGKLIGAPRQIGNSQYPVLCAAPGHYVHEHWDDY